MEYIWDITLSAKEQSILKEELFFKQSSDISPYYEQSFSILNQDKIYDKTIEINSLCRFAGVFQELLHIENDELEEFRKYFFDLAIHFLCDIDLYKGVTKKEIYISKLKQEILNGVYGKEYSEKFEKFSFNEKNMIMPLILRQLEIGSNLIIFRESLNRIYENAMLYQTKENDKFLLLYLGKNRLNNQGKVDFLIDMFLPVDYKIRVFWENHFGVLSVDATMKIDEIEIF